MYITYSEYKEKGGSLSETAFNMYAYEATQKVREKTFDRITTPSEAVKMCMVRLIDVLHKADPTVEKVASFNHDGLSQNMQMATADELNKKAHQLIRSYLINEVADDGTPLMYCGVKII